MAAGLALEQDRLPEFRRRLGRSVERMLGENLHAEAELVIDGWLPLEEADCRWQNSLRNWHLLALATKNSCSPHRDSRSNHTASLAKTATILSWLLKMRVAINSRCCGGVVALKNCPTAI